MMMAKDSDVGDKYIRFDKMFVLLYIAFMGCRICSIDPETTRE